MDVSNSSLCLLVVCADLLNQECIQERWRDDHQIPNPFQSHTSSRHHRRVGGDYYWSCGIGRSVVAVHYVRDRSLFCSNRVNQNKYSLIAGLSRFSSHHPILLWFFSPLYLYLLRRTSTASNSPFLADRNVWCTLAKGLPPSGRCRRGSQLSVKRCAGGPYEPQQCT